MLVEKIKVFFIDFLS